MPPDELVQKWRNSKILLKDALVVAARWGADQELEACCVEVEQMFCWGSARDLRAARRPKPPSLKEQALEALAAIEGDFNTVGDRADTIRRAIEALPND